MTPKRAIERLRKLQDLADPEVAHVAADDVLLKLLEAQGFKAVAEEFKLIRKWYA